ncbi:MAG TPA: CorA family divalent cation transporter [Stellaceae bacterium]|nr:CorA family divalent cation transporter [Stellaceae bacterium]
MDDAIGAASSEQRPGPRGGLHVAHFRQILLWPVYLIAPAAQPDVPDFAQRLLDLAPAGMWREVSDEFTTDPGDFQERHYNEFVAFLPAVQRFLYGHGADGGNGDAAGTPIRVLRRTDIARTRVQLRRGDAPVMFEVAHADLYFFFDIDVAVLALEIYADHVPLSLAQDLMFQFGRAYPSYWEGDGQAGHCPAQVEWLDAGDTVLAVSDYEDRRKYLNFTARHRAVCVSAHWDYLLQPLVLANSGREGPFAYRQLEYHRMPLMAYLALDDPQQLSGADIAGLAMAGGAPGHERHHGAEDRYPHFDAQYDSGRFREIRDSRNSGTRYLSSARALVIVGDARNEIFTDLDHGALSRFRHQDFLLYLIAHFHRAALLMFSDRLAEAVGRLDMRNVAAVQAFRRVTREALETFLRFTHRYWFSQVSDQAETANLFELCRQNLAVDRLYADIRQEVQDMSQYLENEAMRRQNETIVRLTVVTIFGLIGTVVTGFLGMNLFAYSDETRLTKLWLFTAVTVPTVVIMFLMIRKSRQLSEFLDAVSAEEWSLFGKLKRLGRRARR